MMQEREGFASEMYLRKPVAVGSSEQIERIASRSGNIWLTPLEEKAGNMNTVTTIWIDVPRACENFDF